MGKVVKKWPWHVSVEYVEPGIDALEARRRRKSRSSYSNNAITSLLLPIVAFILIIAFGAWWYMGRGAENPLLGKQASAPKKPTVTITATREPTRTGIPEPIMIMTAAVSPTKSISPTLTPVISPSLTPTTMVLEPVFVSPVNPPVISPTVTITPTATPSPYDYQIITHKAITQPETLYPYVSGWIVESDGITPRPVKIELRYPTGMLAFPRPNHNDVSTGYYEFLVSPGEYDLFLAGGPPIHISVSDTPARYEVSLRYLKNDRATVAARSNPWNSHIGGNPPANLASKPEPTATATATPKPIHRVYLPLVLKPIEPTAFIMPVKYIVFLPMVTK